MEFYLDTNTKKVIISANDINLECDHLKKLNANDTDASKEKHVPVVSITGNNIDVVVGSVVHPMTEEHLINMIVVETKTGFLVKNLTSADEPKASFVVNEEVVAVYEYCNLHGLWVTRL